MVRLLLLLLGTRAIRGYWLTLMGVGVVLVLASLGLFADTISDGLHFPIHWFGFLLLLDAGLMLVAAANTWGMQRRMMWIRSTLIGGVGLLVINHVHASSVVLALVLGLAALADACLRIASALVLRFPFWRRYLWLGIGQLGFAVFLLEPWPTHYAGTVEYCLALWLGVTGLTAMIFAVRLRHLPEAALLPQLFSRGWLPFVDVADASARRAGPNEKLVVHVWTAADTAEAPLHRPVIDRYIAAVDAHGVVSTGHAALEIPPDVYVSHYPGVEIDRDPAQFARLFRATVENDIKGRFQPSYAIESAGWCESVWQVTFHASYADIDRARRFWREYSKDDTYNLTRRNCSSTVVQVLEVALEGSLLRRGYGRLDIWRALFSPELWVASQLRKRAETMAWTPGFALDYSRALYGVLHPPQIPWLAVLRRALATERRSRAPVAPRAETLTSGAVKRVDPS